MKENFEENIRKKLDEERGRNPDDEIGEKLIQEGWQRAGWEHLFVTRFNSDTGRFEERKERTEEDIKKEYLERYGEHFDEVSMEPSHTYKYEEWRPDGGIIVYMRRLLNGGENVQEA